MADRDKGTTERRQRRFGFRHGVGIAIVALAALALALFATRERAPDEDAAVVPGEEIPADDLPVAPTE